MLEALQASWLARAVNESQLATASLSSLHLLGFTLIMGSMLLCGLHLLGVLLPEQPLSAIVRPASRLLLVGLCISGLTGLLLVLPRAEGAAMNGTFRLKVLLIVTAVLLHAFVVAPLGARGHGSRATRRFAGLASVVVWAGVAVAGCAFILLD